MNNIIKRSSYFYTAVGLLLLTVVVPLRAHGSRDFSDGSTSIAESKKCRALICPIRVTPDHFTWEGCSIQIHECWLERTHFPDTNGEGIKLTIDIDGNRLEKIDFGEERDPKTGSVSRMNFIVFVEEGPEPHVLAAARAPAANADVVCDNGFYYEPIKQWIKDAVWPLRAHPLERSGQIHVFNFLFKAGQKTPNEVRLRLGTRVYSAGPTKYRFSDTVLTFSLARPDLSNVGHAGLRQPQ